MRVKAVRRMLAIEYQAAQDPRAFVEQTYAEWCAGLQRSLAGDERRCVFPTLRVGVFPGDGHGYEFRMEAQTVP